MPELSGLSESSGSDPFDCIKGDKRSNKLSFIIMNKQIPYQNIANGQK
jgi:hypothetical protein